MAIEGDRARRGGGGGGRQGWFLLGGAAVGFFTSAVLMQSYPVFLLAYLATFDWSRATVSISYSVAQLMAGASSPLVGGLTDRLGARRVVIFGGVLLALGALGNAGVSALWQVIVLYGIVMTFGSVSLGLVVFVPLLSRHFVRRRGLAVAVLQSAGALGRAVATPLAQFTISALGWRETYLAGAALIAVLLPPLARLFGRAEGLRGAFARTFSVSAAPAASSVSSEAARNDWTLARAMRTRHFWLLLAVYMFTGIGSFLVSLHQLAFAVEKGFPKLYAAGVIGTGSSLAIIGIILTGTLSDFIGRELSAMASYAVSILGDVFALFIAGPQDRAYFWLFACLFGITWGARGPAIVSKTADLFAGRHLGRILGVITIGSGLGAAIGSWMAGVIFDYSGSYRLAFVLSIASYSLGAVTFWALRRPAAS